MKFVLTTMSIIISIVLLAVLIVVLNITKDPEIVTKLVYVEIETETTPTHVPPPYVPRTKNKGIWIEPTTTPVKPTAWKYVIKHEPTVEAPSPTPIKASTPTKVFISGLGSDTLAGAFIRPTHKPRPTYENPWIDTFERVGGWCYLTRTNSKTNEVREVPRRQFIYWDYHNNGVETKYKVECRPVNGRENCSSTMPPKLFNEWYNKFGLNIENQALNGRQGCTR